MGTGPRYNLDRPKTPVKSFDAVPVGMDADSQECSEGEGEVRTFDLTPNFSPLSASRARCKPAKQQKSSQYGQILLANCHIGILDHEP